MKLIIEYDLLHWKEEIKNMDDENVIEFIMEHEDWDDIIWRGKAKIEREE